MTENAHDGLRPFHAMEILARAQALEAAGRSLCHLEVGEPASAPAPEVREAVRAVLDEPQRYTHAKGRQSLRAALAKDYRVHNGATVDPEHIIVTNGSSAAFTLAFLAGFAPGAAIAVTRPGYPAYLNILAALGFRPVEIVLSPENDWHLSARAIEAAHDRTPFDGLLFASPANPTGATVDRAVFSDIVGTCERLGVRLISDEIYHGLTYSAPAASAVEFTTDAIVVNSFSKYHCMTGWRVGWMVLPEPVVRKAEMLQQNLFISAPTLSQVGAEAALGARAYADSKCELYRINRDLLVKGLDRLGFGPVRGGEGAFYAYTDISRFGRSAMELCDLLLDKAGVAATPGVDFDRVAGNRFIRFSYAGAREMIEEAIERMSALDLGR
jgi:aspartate/methionine/tyrosine aminotransferase